MKLREIVMMALPLFSTLDYVSAQSAEPTEQVEEEKTRGYGTIYPHDYEGTPLEYSRETFEEKTEKKYAELFEDSSTRTNILTDLEASLRAGYISSEDLEEAKTATDLIVLRNYGADKFLEEKSGYHIDKNTDSLKEEDIGDLRTANTELALARSEEGRVTTRWGRRYNSDATYWQDEITHFLDGKEVWTKRGEAEPLDSETRERVLRNPRTEWTGTDIIATDYGGMTLANPSNTSLGLHIKQGTPSETLSEIVVLKSFGKVLKSLGLTGHITDELKESLERLYLPTDELKESLERKASRPHVPEIFQNFVSYVLSEDSIENKAEILIELDNSIDTTLNEHLKIRDAVRRYINIRNEADDQFETIRDEAQRQRHKKLEESWKKQANFTDEQWETIKTEAADQYKEIFVEAWRQRDNIRREAFFALFGTRIVDVDEANEQEREAHDEVVTQYRMFWDCGFEGLQGAVLSKLEARNENKIKELAKKYDLDFWKENE